MDIEKAGKETLVYLLAAYQEEAGRSYNIGPIAVRNDVNPLQLANYLKGHNFIKTDVQASPDEDSLMASISVKGIMEVDPDFVETRIQHALKGLKSAESIGNVMAILELKPAAFQMAFDLAIEMQNRDLVKLLYAQFDRVVSVEMTLQGMRMKDGKS